MKGHGVYQTYVYIANRGIMPIMPTGGDCLA